MRAREAERQRLLAMRTEKGRLERASKLAGKVLVQVGTPELIIAAVSSYNVVIDATAQRILHGCRDFQREARAGRLCKHVAAVLLDIEVSLALPILRTLAEDEGYWELDMIAPRVGASRAPR
ncbi:MAG: SWIM zinc finger family protein [Acidobacteriota bacterium]